QLNRQCPAVLVELEADLGGGLANLYNLRVASAELETARVDAALLRREQRQQLGRRDTADMSDAQAVVFQNYLALQRDGLFVSAVLHLVIEVRVTDRALDQGDLHGHNVRPGRALKWPKVIQPGHGMWHFPRGAAGKQRGQQP